MKNKTTNIKNNKNVKKEKVNTTKNNKEMNSIKKILLLKRKNKSLKKKISFINVIYYIFAIAASLPIQLKIMDMINEISSDSSYYAILCTSMLLYYILAVLLYYVTAYVIIRQIESKIRNNICSINEIKENDKMEQERILSKIKFDQIVEQIRDF